MNWSRGVGRFVRSECGAVLVHAAAGLIAATGASAIAIDLGMQLVDRAAAQTAADAGALAGAISLGFDSYSDRTASGPAALAAQSVAATNRISSSTSGARTTTVTFPVCPDGFSACIRVDISRTGIPTLFGQFFGTTTSTVNTRAIAEAKGANAIDCMKPFAVPDKWIEHYPNDDTWSPNETYEYYVTRGRYRGTPRPHPDEYVPPTAFNPGTGFTLMSDLGTTVILKMGDPLHTVQPGWFFPVRIPRVSTGGNDYRNNIATCNGIPVGIGDHVQVQPGNVAGPTIQGIQDLIALDPAAYWNSTTKKVAGSCASANPPCARYSPRIIAIPVFSPQEWENSEWQDHVPIGHATVHIVNILGFFVEGLDANDNVLGHLVMMPGLLREGSSLVEAASFVRASVLVR